MEARGSNTSANHPDRMLQYCASETDYKTTYTYTWQRFRGRVRTRLLDLTRGTAMAGEWGLDSKGTLTRGIAMAGEWGLDSKYYTYTWQ
jgi:hypothetical protein